MSDDVKPASNGVKFSQFKKVGPDSSSNLQVVGLKRNENVRADLTTDLVSTNSSVVFRDAKGRFKSTEDLPELNNQLEVNRFLWEEIEKLNEAPDDRLPIFAEDEPAEYPHAEEDESTDLEAGDQWYQVIDPSFDYDNPDPEGLDLFVWTDVDGTFEWVLSEPPAEYVEKKGGDSMEGPLTILTPKGADGRATKRVETLGVFSNSDQSALRLGTTRDRVYVGHNDTSFNGPIKVDEIQEKNVGGGVEFADRVILKVEGVEDDEAVTKKYIDDKTRHLQDEIVELEEEIDAIAPSVERGRWTFTAVGTVAQQGQFTMYDADFGNGSPTGLFKSARSIWFNELDLDSTPHSFANVKDGELLEIFIDGSPDYGLFSVTGEAHDETQSGAKFWVIDVDFVRTNEATTAIGPGEVCRFKIFNAPSGGEATSFVMKTGDTMSGKLQLDKARGDNDNGDGFTVKGAITDGYSSSNIVDQTGNLLQVNHIARNPDEINYLGRIKTDKNITTKEYVDAQMSELMKKIEELEMASASEVGRNIKGIVLADTRANVQYGYVGPVSSNGDSINISIPGVSIAPRGQITLREDGENDRVERFTFNILDATNTGNDTKGARWNVKVVLDGSTDSGIGYDLRTNRRRTEVGLINGAWAQEPVSGAVKFRVYSDDIVESGAVTDPLKAYALDDYGNLDTNVDGYAYGLFIPFEYLNTITKYEADGDIDGQMMRVYGTTESSKGIIERIAVNEERMEDAEYNGIKGIKAWAFSRFSANSRIEMTMTNVLIMRAPDRDHELNEYSVDEGSVADASSDDKS